MFPIYEYKGYKTIIRYSQEDKVYYGSLEDIDDLIMWESEMLERAEKKFQEAVDDYLEFCKSVSKEPNKPEKVEVE